MNTKPGKRRRASCQSQYHYFFLGGASLVACLAISTCRFFWLVLSFLT